MKFTETKIPGAFVIEIEPRGDERGFFARVFCAKEFKEHGIPTDLVQGNISWSRDAGTIRGMHYQVEPYAEDKLFRCTKGAIYQVIVDLRKDSPTYKQWVGTELNAENHRMLFVPKGCSNCVQTLLPDTEGSYFVTQFYTPTAEQGLRWNDPAFNINWPIKDAIVSDKDKAWPDFQG